MSQSSYPIIGALQKETFVPFTDKIANLILAIPEPKLGKALDLGIDVLLTAKPEPLSSLTALVKESYKVAALPPPPISRSPPPPISRSLPPPISRI